MSGGHLIEFWWVVLEVMGSVKWNGRGQGWMKVRKCGGDGGGGVRNSRVLREW